VDLCQCGERPVSYDLRLLQSVFVAVAAAVTGMHGSRALPGLDQDPRSCRLRSFSFEVVAASPIRRARLRVDSRQRRKRAVRNDSSLLRVVVDRVRYGAPVHFRDAESCGVWLGENLRHARQRPVRDDPRL